MDFWKKNIPMKIQNSQIKAVQTDIFLAQYFHHKYFTTFVSNRSKYQMDILSNFRGNGAYRIISNDCSFEFCRIFTEHLVAFERFSFSYYLQCSVLKYFMCE